ncbi:MAG: hypothetical protein BGO01_10410 [Armatimonadetes bacterium 55-13]|nr:GlsB/YeaQ/YmgE family stress response membrane protein [Armatimonadota bacterium]OJU62810.1 MAG: hypothetical protein BGO01_10410 [Armatimonadetes bacterium 55-13]
MEHGWIWWILVGGIAGILAKALTPGKKGEPTGCVMTILLGIGGSVLTGFIMRNLLRTSGGGGFAGSIVGATIGALVLIFIFKKFWSK